MDMIDGFINLRHFSDSMEKESSAGAVIVNDEKFLLLHYASGHWDFVKGKIEKGESEKETVVRECEEETGISDLLFVSGFKEETHYFYTRETKTISKSVVFFLAKTSTSEVVISHEHIGFKWLSYEEALKKLTFVNAKKVLEKAYKVL